MELLRKHLRKFAFLFGVPLISLLVFELALAWQHQDWERAVREELPGVSGRDLKALGLSGICAANTHLPASNMCRNLQSLKRLSQLALFMVAAVAVILGATHSAGQRCRRDRQLLIRVFVPGSRIMGVVSAGVVVGMAVLFGSAVYYLFATFLDRVPSGLIFVTALGAILALYNIGRTLVRSGRLEATRTDGQVLPRGSAPELWSLVESVARQARTQPPANILAGSEATFFVTENPVTANTGVLHGRTLYLSLPLTQMLTRNQLRAVVAHEMAHFQAEDTQAGLRMGKGFRHSYDTLREVANAAESARAGGWALLAAISLLAFYVESFEEAEAEISRERELAADAAAARATSAEDLALALIKLEAHGEAWGAVMDEMLDRREDDPAPAPSQRFLEIAESRFAAADPAEAIASLEQSQIPHPTDSHPPLSVRVNALGFTVAELYGRAGNVRPPDSTSELIPNAADLESDAARTIVPKSEEVERIFSRRQAGFAAMEYYAGILNRTFLVFVAEDGLHMLKMRGLVSANEPLYFEPLLELLNDPFMAPGSREFIEFAQRYKQTLVPYSDLVAVEFDHRRKWGMGAIAHAGKLRLRFTNNRTREMILLGHAYGDGIARYIGERLGPSRAKRQAPWPLGPATR